MADNTYRLGRDDKMALIDANGLSDAEDDPAYTLLIELADGRWLAYNRTTDKVSNAAWLMGKTRRDGIVHLSDWTDVTFLRGMVALDWTTSLSAAGFGKESSGRLRPACPEAPELSRLLPGDSVHVMRSIQPGDLGKVLWTVMLHLSEGVWLQYIVPFEKSAEAESVLRGMAQTNAFVTDDFTDITEEMEDIQIDRSGEIEIDQSGNRRTIQ